MIREIRTIFENWRVGPTAQYNREKQIVSDRISGGPHMTREDLERMSLEADRAMERVRQLVAR